MAALAHWRWDRCAIVPAMDDQESADLVEEQVKASQPARAWDPMDKRVVARLIIGAAIVALFATFAVQNGASVDVQLLSWTIRVRQFLVMLLSAVAGVAIWKLAGVYARRAKKQRVKAANKK